MYAINDIKKPSFLYMVSSTTDFVMKLNVRTRIEASTSISLLSNNKYIASLSSCQATPLP